MKRDYIIFIVAMGILAGGLTDGLHRGFGLPLPAAVPIAGTFWAIVSYRIYLQSRKEQAEEAKEVEA